MSSRKRKQYDDSDLIGLTVAHSENDFQEGQQVILTLADKDVLDEGEDVLENVQLNDVSKAARNVREKSGSGPGVYKPYADVDDENGLTSGGRSTLLSKYDEEIDGIKIDKFRIGLTAAEKQRKLDEIKEQLRKDSGSVSLERVEYKVASEYMSEHEVNAFKKPRKKSKLGKKGKKGLKADDLQPLTEDTESHLRSRTKVEAEESIEDEVANEHAQLISEMLRKRKQTNVKSDSGKRSSKSKESKFELSKVQKESDEEEDDDLKIPDEEIYGMVLEEDDLQLDLQKAVEKARKLKQKEVDEQKTIEKMVDQVKALEPNDEQRTGDDTGALLFEPPNNDVVLNSTAEFCRNLGDYQTIKQEAQDEDLMDFENDLMEERAVRDRGASANEKNQWSEVDVKSELPRLTEGMEGQPILEEEPDVSVGVAGALQLAMKKGYLDKEMNKANLSAKASQLQAKNYLIEEKFYDDDRYGRRERFSGPISEFKEKSGYQPDVKLEYVDDVGRLMNEKEAFRVLSHKFHGKGPGKNKIDKRMKKLDQESVRSYRTFYFSFNLILILFFY
jgi:U4/U6.U5 tri-snRNP-associated protein 1